MKQILLMRHAKSSWENPDLKDFDRPLAKRGLNDAPRMGKYLKKIKYKPALVISSPAQRAKETTQLSMEAAKLDEQQITWNDDLYFGSVRDYLGAIQSASDEFERIMLVGHNPLMESTTGVLAGGQDKTAVRMPTAAIVCLESFADSWETIAPGTCQIKWMMIPKVVKKL
ncbi:MAG: histidine phosphatase family protein [Gracilimonas sp.]|uniref:SixA phosphatase family protein n=1 Tax=Gracilimonas TaxID=649462 RepID=UPI001B2518D0|nr:histidine phosphatase family protein [Gracilimonas sp.]MBO6584602.1 histidine phosphatase family protein [Gracilimonas sp.]MBO6616127.1 histidine phosphatase family protein [Gracilimonas sp.]